MMCGIFYGSPSFANKGPYSHSYSFSSSEVRMWELDCKEGWVPKNWCFQIMVLEKMLENPLNCKIKPINPERNQQWLFTGRTDAEAEAPILWPPDAKGSLIRKDPDAGKDWGHKDYGGDDRGWAGWMVSPIQWTWVWANSGRWWGIGEPGIL